MLDTGPENDPRMDALHRRLQATVERHRTTANDLQNLLYSTDVATLFLDNDLNIRFFTPAASAIFHVTLVDVGRPLADLAFGAGDGDLHADARGALETLEPCEREVESDEARRFERRILPYRAEGGRIDGVVITYRDITENNRSGAGLNTSPQEADRATGSHARFLTAASHDLRQLLQSMALLHEMLAHRGRWAESARLVALLDQTLQSITELLDVNRIGPGNVTAKVVPVPLIPIRQWPADVSGCEMRSEGLDLPVDMLTGQGAVAMAVASPQAGAPELIEKPSEAADQPTGVPEATEEGSDGDIRSKSEAARKQFESLTAREHAVLVRVLEGRPNKIIAADLGINQRTVENHRASVMRKTGAASLPALVRLSLAADI